MKWLLLMVFVMSNASHAYESLTAEAIIQAADEVRNPAECFFLRVQVTTEGDEEHLFHVAMRGTSKTLVETVQPANERGRYLLMLDENMWAYVPNLKRSIRIALNQKLTGETANGDIARMRWSGDYSAQLEGEDEDRWIINLTAQKQGLTYDRIRVWIQKGSFHPLEAEYLTSAGKVLKRASFQKYCLMEGKLRPTEIHIQDAIRSSDASVIRIQEMSVRSFPEAIFKQTTLGDTHLLAGP